MNIFSHTHRAILRLGIVFALLLFVLPSIVIAQEQLNWELVLPFRFIRHEELMDELKQAYASSGHRSAEELEKKLQQKHEEEVEQRRREDLRDCIAKALGSPEECQDRTRYPFSGWFSKLAYDNYNATCWDARNLQFRREPGCDPALTPTRFRIRVWLESDRSFPMINYLWTSGDTQLENPGPCRFTRHQICREFDVNIAPERPVRVSLSTPDTAVVAVSEPIAIRHTLIVGLGDSYASGEGNPDIPAQFMERQSDVDFAYFWKWRRTPRKDRSDPSYRPPNGGDATVEWLDRRCHRSMYSYQFKTALLFSLSRPKESVSFVSYSCSGGTTDNIIDKNQKPNEEMRSGASNTILPQLKMLREAIGGREIDYLLVSTGGNDLKFSKYVANLVTSGRTRVMLKVFRQALRATEERTEKGLTKLRGSYERFNDSLLASHSGIKLRSCHGRPCPERIILNAYPKLFTNERVEPCDVKRDEFTLPFNTDPGRKKRMKNIRDLLAERLWEFQRTLSIGWTVATLHRDKFDGNGFCAQRYAANTPLSVNENFMMLRRKKGEWYAYDWRDKDSKRRYLYDPREYKPYDPSRARWIRLPVDSKMTADQQNQFLNWFSYDFFFLDERSSVMHPTALAHAVIADSNLKAMANAPIQ